MYSRFMPPLWMVLRPFISWCSVSHPALRVSPVPPPVVPAVAVVALVLAPVPFGPTVVVPTPPLDPLEPRPPDEDMPPIDVTPVPLTLDAPLVVVPVVPLADAEV